MNIDTTNKESLGGGRAGLVGGTGKGRSCGDGYNNMGVDGGAMKKMAEGVEAGVVKGATRGWGGAEG